MPPGSLERLDPAFGKGGLKTVPPQGTFNSSRDNVVVVNDENAGHR